MPDDSSRATLERFARTHDPQCLASHAQLVTMTDRRTIRGRGDIAAFLRQLLYESFADAHLAVQTTSLDERNGIGAIEWLFSGRHIAPAFDLPPSGRVLALPLTAICELSGGGITCSRLYFDAATVRRQLTPNTQEEIDRWTTA